MASITQVIVFVTFLVGTGGNACQTDFYMDDATRICQPCTNCCHPRPKNPFCKVCDLGNVCRTEPPNGQVDGRIYIAVTLCIVLLSLIAIICLVPRTRKWIFARINCCKKLKHRNRNGGPVQPTESVNLNNPTTESHPGVPGERQEEQISLRSEAQPDQNSRCRSPADSTCRSMPTKGPEAKHDVLHSLPQATTMLEIDGYRFIREDQIRSPAPAQVEQPPTSLRYDQHDHRALYPSLGSIPVQCQEDKDKEYPRNPNDTKVKMPLHFD